MTKRQIIDRMVETYANTKSEYALVNRFRLRVMDKKDKS